MCLGNNQPKPPEVIAPTPPPPIKPPEIARTSQLQSPRQIKESERLKVKYGAKSNRNSTAKKRDAASLLAPMNAPGNNQGGINT